MTRAVRRRAGRGAARARRGAVLPLVCVLLAVLVGAAGLAIDVSRMHAAAAELQTAADAGALAGARGFLADPGNAAGGVTAAARLLATRNAVLGRTIASGEVAVDPMRRADDGSVAVATWATANGVRVTVERTTPFIFGAIPGLTTPTVRRQATAWLASVKTAVCARPLGLSFQWAWEQTGHTGTAGLSDAVTGTDLAGLGSQTAAQRTRELAGAYGSSERADYKNGSVWAPVTLDPNNSKGGYNDQFDPVAANCSRYTAEVGDGVTALNGASAQGAAHDGMARLCGTTAARCGANGTVVRVSWLGPATATTKGGSSGANGAEVRLLGLVRIHCYFGAAYNSGNLATSDCPATGYARRPGGTLVVEMLPPGALGFMTGDKFGTMVSGIQRLMLVQ